MLHVSGDEAALVPPLLQAFVDFLREPHRYLSRQQFQKVSGLSVETLDRHPTQGEPSASAAPVGFFYARLPLWA